MLGIDLGARKISIVDVEGPWAYHLEVKPDTREGEIREMAVRLRGLRDDGLLTGTKWVEAPLLAGARNIQSTIQVAQTSGLVLGTLPDAHQVAVAAWKKRTVGSGNADKGAVAAWLREFHPRLAALCGANQDLVDAACIGLYGASVAADLAAAGLAAGQR